MKTCPSCKISKEDSDFYKRNPYCKPCASAKSRQWYLKNRARKYQINQSWRKRNHPRYTLTNYASQVVFNALRSGTLTKPNTCSKCGSTGFIEAAHANYSNLLDITWLCRKCHRSWDGRNPKTKF